MRLNADDIILHCNFGEIFLDTAIHCIELWRIAKKLDAGFQNVLEMETGVQRVPSGSPYSEELPKNSYCSLKSGGSKGVVHQALAVRKFRGKFRNN